MKVGAVAAVAVVLGCLATGQALGAPGPHQVEPAARSFRLGALQLVALSDAQFVEANDAKTFGVDAGPAAVAAVLKSAGAPTEEIVLAVDALLVKASGRMMLLDAGLGPSAHGVLQASLAKAGVAAADITDVLITHTHGDHIGGLVSAGGGLAFPNATIRMSRSEWAWMETQPRSGKLAALLAPRVKTFVPGMAIAPGVTPIAIPGHTPGHVGYEIVSGSARLLDIGDAAHSAIVSLAKPGWVMGFDNDPVGGRASRLTTLALVAHEHELVFAPHFPFPGVGTIETVGDGYVWKPGVP